MSAADTFPSPSNPWLPSEAEGGNTRRSRRQTAAAREATQGRSQPIAGASPAVRAALGGLSAIAFGLSGYLAWAAFTSGNVAGCGSGAVFDCGHVLSSRWSKVVGVPVSIPALLTHLAIIGLVSVSPSSPRWQMRRWALTAFAVMTAAAAALWFLALQIFWIQHLCVYCVGAHLCGLIAAGVLLWSRPLPAKAMGWAGGAAAASLALLVTIQSTTAAAPSYEVIEHEAAPSGPSQSVPAAEAESSPGGAEPGLFEAPAAVSDSPQASAGAPSPDRPMAWAETLSAVQWPSLAAATLSPASLLTAQVGAGQQPAGGRQSSGETSEAAQPNQEEPRLISVLDGIRLNPQHWPIVGDPEAELVFAELLDYTCPHCRTTHMAMKGAKERYGDRLAVLVLPVPMDRDCNPTVSSTNAQHSEACELAKLAIAFWRVSPDQFERFHNYLFESQPSYVQAKAHAGQLVDAEKLESELAGSVPADYISKHVALYRRAGAGAIPKLMFPGATTVGEVGSADTLIQMIEQRLAR